MDFLSDSFHILEEELRHNRDEAQHWNVPHDRIAIPDRGCNFHIGSRNPHNHCRRNPTDSRVLLYPRTDGHGSTANAWTNGHTTSLRHNVADSAITSSSLHGTIQRQNFFFFKETPPPDSSSFPHQPPLPI